MTENELKANIESVRARIDALSGGREVRLVAATKTVPADIINLLPKYNITCAGENTAQEFLSKADAVQGIEWHFIGALQTNKVKHLVGKVVLIQSVDRLSLAAEIERQCAKRGITADVLLEVNIGREPQKSGVAPEELSILAEAVAAFPHIRMRGLMSVLPAALDVEKQRDLYLQMNRLYGIFKDKYADADVLSMGMSGDFETAVSCGSNMVRVGSAIFGRRA